MLPFLDRVEDSKMDINRITITTFLSILMTKSVVKAQGAIDYEGCSDQHQCFGYPEGCINNKNCEMMTSLKISGEKLDAKLMKSNIEGSNFVAMAFSDDQMMGKDLVFACSPSWMEQEAVKPFWNKEGKTPSELLNENDYIIPDSDASHSNSFLTCSFTLETNATVKGTIFDFKKGHYILLATGPAGDAKLDYHGESKVASKSKFENYGNQKGDGKDANGSATDGGDGKAETGSATDGGDGMEATGSATNQFISILAISLTFVPFF